MAEYVATILHTDPIGSPTQADALSKGCISIAIEEQVSRASTVKIQTSEGSQPRPYNLDTNIMDESEEGTVLEEAVDVGTVMEGAVVAGTVMEGAVMEDSDIETAVAEEVITNEIKVEPKVAMPKEMESITAGLTNATNALDKSKITPKPIILFKWGTKERPFRCQMCEMSFETGDSLQEHINKHQMASWDGKPFPCKICPKAFRSKKMLERHILVHFGQSTKRCKFCFRPFSNKENLEKHMEEHGGRRPHKCPHCDEAFAYKLGLSNHIVTHTGVRNFVCEFCKKAFNRKDILDRHRLLHTGGGKRHICVECNKTFAHSFVLKRHTRCVHAGETIQCNVCGKHIKGKENLSRHMKLHRGERPFVCSICSKAFTQNHHLKDHMIVHTQERNFHCDQCTESFVHKRSYTRHLLRHLGKERPLHNCPICDRNFKEKGSLTKHLLVHGNSSHQCKFCKAGFRLEKQLIRHLNRVHDEEIRQLALQKSLAAKADGEQVVEERIERKTTGQVDYVSGGKMVHNPVVELVFPENIKRETQPEVVQTVTEDNTVHNPVMEVVFAEDMGNESKREIVAGVTENNTETDMSNALSGGTMTHIQGSNSDASERVSSNIIVIAKNLSNYVQRQNMKVVYHKPVETGTKSEVIKLKVPECAEKKVVMQKNVKGGNSVMSQGVVSIAENRVPYHGQPVEVFTGSCKQPVGHGSIPVAKIHMNMKGDNQSHIAMCPSNIKGGNSSQLQAVVGSVSGRVMSHRQSVKLQPGSNLIQQSLTAVSSLKDSIARKTVSGYAETSSRLNQAARNQEATNIVRLTSSGNGQGVLGVEVSNSGFKIVDSKSITVTNSAMTNISTTVPIRPEVKVASIIGQGSQSEGAVTVGDNNQSLISADQPGSAVEGKQTDRHMDIRLLSMEQEHSNLIQSIIDYAEQLKKSDNTTSDSIDNTSESIDNSTSDSMDNTTSDSIENINRDSIENTT